jgi:phenylacetate-CoA ligase
MEIPGVGNNFVIILEREGYDDYLTVKVEVQNEVFTGDLRPLENLRKRIIDELKADILITPRVNLVEPGSLPSSEGKAVRVIDNRKE